MDSTNRDGNTPLHFAVSNRDLDAVNALIEAGACVNSKDSLGRTALHLSICNSVSTDPDTECDISVVERLLCHPEIILDPTDEEGETPLLWAVRERNADVVKVLLKKGSDPNVPNRRRRTPLLESLSTEYPHYDIVGLLLWYGADIYSKDIYQQTAVDLLVRSVHDGDCETILFVKHVLWLVALRYHIKDCFWRTLEQIPYLRHFLKDCFKEVNLMKKKIIYDNVTLHDFALNVFQTTCPDPLREIYLPVVEVLVFGSFQIYGDFIFCRLSEPYFHSVLGKTVGRSLDLNFAPSGVSRKLAFIIRLAYGYNAPLIKRLRRLEHLF